VEKCIIIGSAPNTDLSDLKPLLESNIPVICADGGIKTACFSGIQPFLFIGDLDSGSKPENVDCVILPVEKDYTDTHTAIIKAINMGAKELYLLGCTNGRADHYLANIMLLEMIAEQGARGAIWDTQNRILFHSGGCLAFQRSDSPFSWDGNAVVVPKNFKYISIMPIDSKLTGVTIRGMKYSLENACLNRRIPIGVSNELVADKAEINVENGKCIIILSKDVE